MPIPVLLVGDAPETVSGLGRILRDLRLLLTHPSLDLDVATCAWSQAELYPRYGALTGKADWRFSDLRDYGLRAVDTAWSYFFGDRPGILFTIWDPSRCYEFATWEGLPAGSQRWGYFAVDGANHDGGFGGPAAEAVKGYDRVLAYTHYGATVLKRILGEDVDHLPHGIHTNFFHPATPEGLDVRRYLGPLMTPQTQVIGCVATNQPRKDLGMVFSTMRLLLDRGEDVHLWLHTDEEIGEAWSIPQLFEDYRLMGRFAMTRLLPDAELAALYSLCTVTIAPGRGEGFGYPILESLWSGTPAVHVAYGGGAEFTCLDDRVPSAFLHPEGPYNILRPIVYPADVAKIVQRHLKKGKQPIVMTEAALATAWQVLGPRWHAWVREGLAPFRTFNPEGGL